MNNKQLLLQIIIYNLISKNSFIINKNRFGQIWSTDFNGTIIACVKLTIISL